MNKQLLKRIFWIATSIFVLHCLIIIIFGLTASTDRSLKADYIFILGNRVELTGTPSKRLQKRLDKGLELYQKKFAPKIIVSGGIGKEGFDEAKVMANYLIEKGIDASDIIQDNKGITTFASAENCVTILNETNATSIIIVSQYFHLLRSKIAFRKMFAVRSLKLRTANIKLQTAAADVYFEKRDFYSIPREIIGIYYYLFRNYKKQIRC